MGSRIDTRHRHVHPSCASNTITHWTPDLSTATDNRRLLEPSSCRAAAAADEGYDLVLAAASGSLGAGRERRDQPADDPAASRLAPTESEPESGDLRVPLAPIAGSRLRWFSALHPSISPRTAENLLRLEKKGVLICLLYGLHASLELFDVRLIRASFTVSSVSRVAFSCFFCTSSSDGTPSTGGSIVALPLLLRLLPPAETKAAPFPLRRR
ncbi:hypothetical protein MUK42_24943 [Musa troglodytarum]|uniref:Uncharacterized protein n=1 Tax=Musa troglodytarum TaxID=320322 RepID=A0A9E7J9M0_9LILI|nr:hypothetical protein MUK42_24943 [Musa troglodytarum]